MDGHVLTKELIVDESSAAEMTQNPDIVEESSQISRNNSDNDDASSTGLHLGKSSDNLITLPSLETIEPPSSGESFSIDEFVSGLDEGNEPSLVPPQPDGETRVHVASFLDQFNNPLSRTTTATTASSRASSITQHSVMTSRSIFRHTTVSAATLASATAFYSEYLGSRPYKTYTVRTFCESFFNSHRAASAKIVSVKRYRRRFGVPHRFLIFHIVRTDGKDFYLRVDRRPDHDVPLWEFGIQNLGRSNAADTVAISGRLDHLHDYTEAKAEAVMTFPNPPPLIATARILYAIAVESQGYSLTKENCWFFASVIQEALIGKFGGQYESGSLNNPRYGKGVRPSIICRVYFGSTALADYLSRDGNAAELMRNLYCVHPDQYRRDLAQRLQRYGVSLHSAGLPEAARDAHAGAAELTRELDRVHPDQYRNNLAQQPYNYAYSFRDYRLPQLVVAIDIGTVKSAVNIFYRSTRHVEGMRLPVDQWPGLEKLRWSQCVPSVLLYDDNSQLIECGSKAAELQQENDGKWFYVEHFKMHLHPERIRGGNSLPLNGLPPGVSITKVYSDYMAYLIGHTKKHIEDYLGSGTGIAQLFSEQGEIILAHPNHWGSTEQNILKKAAVQAGIITESGLSRRLHFVEEAEASALFYLSATPTFAARMTPGTKFVVCDAGESTVDITAYQVIRKTHCRTHLREFEQPSRRYVGGARVDNEFREYLTRKLYNGSQTGDAYKDEMIAMGLQHFRYSVKTVFESSEDPYQVNIGSRRDNIEELSVKKGRMSIPGGDAESFFLPSVEDITASLQKRFKPGNKISFLILAGGFGRNPYLQKCLIRDFGKEKVVLADPSNLNPVSAGALHLLADTHGAIIVDRQPQGRSTWATNLLTRAVSFGIGAQ